MNCVRISKYEENTNVHTEEWTSISDIGKRYGNNVLTYDEYLLIENHYLTCIDEIMTAANQATFRIENLEKYSKVQWKNNQLIDVSNMIRFVRDCLREKCWARLIGENSYVHIGYDFYIYVGVSIDLSTVFSIVKENQLHCKEMVSPYLHLDRDDG